MPRLCRGIVLRKIMAVENNNEEFQYIKERMKQRPINRKKLVRRTILTASMAVIFGVLACFTFLVLEPVFTNLLYPQEEPQIVEIPEDEDEILPEDMMLVERKVPSTITRIIEHKSDVDPMQVYEDQYTDMYSISREILKSIVTIEGYNQDVDWFDNEYASKTNTTGLYIADNGLQLLFLTHNDVIKNASEIVVTFYDGTVASGAIKQSDYNTGLSIVAVNIDDVGSATMQNIVPAVLANSKVTSLLATPVIAVGKLYGTKEAVGYGMIVSKGEYINLVDQNYEMLMTNIYGSTVATGVITNTRGEVLGIIDQTYNSGEVSNIVSAIGISEIKKDIERMSNGKNRARMGIYGIDVPDRAHEELGVPYGAYVTNIVMGSPAMAAGIQSGDIIVKVAGKDILRFSDFTDCMIDRMVDVTIPVSVRRQGVDEYRELELEITLDELK